MPNAEAGMYSVIPSGLVSLDFSSFKETFGAVFTVDFGALKIGDFLIIMFSFLFVDLFDTLGTLIGVSSKANMLDEQGKLPRIKPALLSDAIATCVGAVFGTSTTTTFVESASGVTAGAYGADHGWAVPALRYFLPAIFKHPFFCDSAGIDYCRVLYDGVCRQD